MAEVSRRDSSPQACQVFIDPLKTGVLGGWGLWPPLGKLDSGRCSQASAMRSLETTCSPSLVEGRTAGLQASLGKAALHSATPTPECPAFLGFSSSGLWNLLRILSPQDEESRCRSAYQVPRHLPSPQGLQLSSPSFSSDRGPSLQWQVAE